VPGLLIRFGRFFSIIERSLWFVVLLVFRILTSPFRASKRRSQYHHGSDHFPEHSSGKSRRRRRRSSSDDSRS
jgi:hypothetical protein